MALNSSNRTSDSIPADETRVKGLRLLPRNRSKDFAGCDVKEDIELREAIFIFFLKPEIEMWKKVSNRAEGKVLLSCCRSYKSFFNSRQG